MNRNGLEHGRGAQDIAPRPRREPGGSNNVWSRRVYEPVGSGWIRQIGVTRDLSDIASGRILHAHATLAGAVALFIQQSVLRRARQAVGANGGI